ncbi:MAG: hypothetical protein M9949_14295 [Candidatus Kapabacteria bacterium]|nr:hypothetical protein [Candidatus Kapabacteria bacterium]
MTPEQKTILKNAIKQFGVPEQLDMAIEECAELIQAINKIKRWKLVFPIHIKKPTYDTRQVLAYHTLCSEVADVKIMMAQLEIMLDSEIIQTCLDRKIERLNNKFNGF